MASGIIPRPGNTLRFNLANGTTKTFTLSSGQYIFYSFASYASIRKMSMIICAGTNVTVTDIYANATDSIPLTGSNTNELTIDNQHASGTAYCYLYAMDGDISLPTP